MVFVEETGAFLSKYPFGYESARIPGVSEINNYLKDENISEDYQTMFVSAFEDAMIAASQQLLITGEINVDKFVEQVEKIAADHR